MTPILALRVFRKSFPSQLEALKPSCIMNFLSRKYVQNGSLTCFLMRISERELRFPDSFSSILTMAFKILLLGMNHGLISSQFHLKMTIKFGSVGKKTVPKSQERQKIVKNGCFAFSSQ